jgi:hypothetical protein
MPRRAVIEGGWVDGWALTAPRAGATSAAAARAARTDGGDWAGWRAGLRRLTDSAEAFAGFAVESGCGLQERPVVAPVCEGHHFSVWRSAVLSLELTVDQSMRRTKFDVVAKFGDDCELDLGTVTQIVLLVRQAFAVVLLLTAVGEGAQPELQGLEFASAQPSRTLGLCSATECG